MKNLLIIIGLILLAILMTSCRSKKTTTDIQRDTIYKSEIIRITPSQLNSLVIESICDSLGQLKPFNYTFGSGKTKTIIKTLDNKIYIEQNIDSIVNSRLKEYKSSLKDREVIITKYKTPKLAWYSYALNILFLLWTFKTPLLKLIK